MCILTRHNEPLLHYTRLTASLPGQPEKAGTRKERPLWISMMQDRMGFWDVVASAGPYANNPHLVPERQPHQHLIAQFLEARCSS